MDTGRFYTTVLKANKTAVLVLGSLPSFKRSRRSSIMGMGRLKRKYISSALSLSLSLSDLEQQRRGAEVLRIQPGPDRCQVRSFGPHLHMKEKDKKVTVA